MAEGSFLQADITLTHLCWRTSHDVLHLYFRPIPTTFLSNPVSHKVCCLNVIYQTAFGTPQNLIIIITFDVANDDQYMR